MHKPGDYEQYSDEELLELLRKSDGLAFSEIFRRYKKVLLNYTYRRIADKEEAKDLIHDVFVNLWEKREHIYVPGELRPFLITVVKNRILDHYKHVKISRLYTDNFNTYLLTHYDADHLARHNQLNRQIEKEIAGLPQKIQTVFELSRKKYMNRKEIANYLNIPEENVKTNLRRALKHLRDTLKYQINL